MPASRPRCILFDAVGTLLRPTPDVVTVYQRTGRRHGVSLSRGEIESRFAKAFRRQFASSMTTERGERTSWRAVVDEVFQTGGEAGDALFQALWRHFSSPGHWSLFDDVPSTWRELRAQGFPLAIASNFDQRLRHIVAKSPPLDTAAHVFTSAEMGFRKPDSRFFRAVESALRLPPDQLLLVGDDRLADYDGALAAGWQALHVNRFAGSKDAPAEIPQLGGLARLLASN